MAHGAPDYSHVRKAVSVFRLDDMAELAVRLGSPNLWDRRGDTFFLDSFEDGITKWTVFDDGGDEAAVVSALAPMHGAFCAQLTTQTGSGGYIGLQQGFPLTASPRLGFETHIKPVSYAGIYDMYIYWYTGTEKKSGYIRLSFNLDRIQYKDDTGTFQTLIDNLDPEPVVSYYHFLKWVIDFENEEYLWLRYNEQTELMTDLAIQVTADTTAPHLEVYILFYDSAAGQGKIRLDCVVLTQDEE